MSVQALTMQEQMDEIWAALWARGYDAYDLIERLAEAALEDVAIGWAIPDAISSAERRYGVKPHNSWCRQCRCGDVECCYTPGVCSDCGGDLEVA